MGLEELKKEILKKGEEEAKSVRKKAEAEAKYMLTQAHEKNKSAVEDAKKEVSDALDREKRERLSTSRLQAKLIISEAKEELLREVDEEVWKELASFRKKGEYAKFLARVIQAGVKEIGEDAVVSVPKEDAQLAKKVIAEKKIKASLSQKPIEAQGGALVTTKDGRVRFDSTFEAIMEEKEDKRKLAFDMLFRK